MLAMQVRPPCPRVSLMCAAARTRMHAHASTPARTQTHTQLAGNGLGSWSSLQGLACMLAMHAQRYHMPPVSEAACPARALPAPAWCMPHDVNSLPCEICHAGCAGRSTAINAQSACAVLAEHVDALQFSLSPGVRTSARAVPPKRRNWPHTGCACVRVCSCSGMWMCVCARACVCVCVCALAYAELRSFQGQRL